MQSPTAIPLDPSLYHAASSSMPPSSYPYHVQFQNAAAVSPPPSTTAATTPTASTALFSSQPLPIMQPPGSVTLQSLQGQAHSQQQQSNMNTNPLYQLMHSQSQLQQQQHQQHLQQQQQQLQLQQQQQQQQSHQPEASTSTHNNMSGGAGYIGTPLIDSSGPASPVDDSSLSARDRRASKKGTKRPRPTLSCTECVRRKSKCDRVRSNSFPLSLSRSSVILQHASCLTVRTFCTFRSASKANLRYCYTNRSFHAQHASREDHRTNVR